MSNIVCKYPLGRNGIAGILCVVTRSGSGAPSSLSSAIADLLAPPGDAVSSASFTIDAGGH